STMDAALLAIQEELRARGFQVEPSDSRWPKEMLNDLPPEVRSRMSRTISFWRHRSEPVKEDLHGDIIVYANSGEETDRPQNSADLDARYPFIELRLTEIRPGGFSPNGLRVYDGIIRYLRDQNYNVIIISEPPPTNEREHFRITAMNAFSMGIWWILSWAASMAIFGGLTELGLRAVRARQTIRRLVLICVGVAFVTPMPVSSMFVTFMLPNVLHLSIGAKGYAALAAEFGNHAIVGAFLVSLCLSAFVAIFFVRDRKSKIASQ
ncbi:MAG: hypothetical protein RIC52_04590, partial [Amphiplicatus sp.]